MLQSLSSSRKLFYALGLPLWVFFGFMLAQSLMYAGLWTAHELGVSFASFNEAVLSTIFAAIIYVLSIVIVIGAPWLVKHHRTSLKEVGLHRLPQWMDMLWAPTALIAYMIVSVFVLWAASQLFTFIDVSQSQETGFEGITQRFEFLLAFVSLVVIAPLAEEVLFRGYLLGKLRKYTDTWVAVLVTSLLFGVVHFAWNVGVDVFVLSIALCVLRLKTGSLWAPILLHMLKNGIAFYFIFVNPLSLM